jgi:hypothetical protein
MPGWESLRVDLRRLLEDEPGAFMAMPDPDSERYEKRIRMDLAPWATGIADELNTRYGDLVDLRVGAKSFPDGQLWIREPWSRLHGEPAETTGLDAALLSPLTVRTGRDARREVLVTNRATQSQVLLSNGMLSSAVVDGSGRVVGQYVGPSPSVRVGFEIGPQQSRPVPVWIGTASVVPDLGYAVPPGKWGLLVGLGTEKGSFWSAPLEITITL